MRLTPRDIALLRLLAFLMVMSRDQILKFGLFTSVTRLNTRLRQLIKLGLIRRLDTSFFTQSLYILGPKAHEVLTGQEASLAKSRSVSPRFIQHALTVTDVRLALTGRSDGEWRYEQTLWRKLPGLDTYEIRPDGLLIGKVPIFVEVDLGHVSLPKFRKKLVAYRALALSGSCQYLYGFSDFRLLVVTTGKLRSRHLSRQLPSDPGFELLVQTFDDLGVAPTPNWS